LFLKYLPLYCIKNMVKGACTIKLFTDVVVTVL
jgi:hypothetical protein